MKNLLCQNIKRILTLILILLPFLNQAQENLKNINKLKKEILKLENKKNISSEEYANHLNNLGILYYKQEKYSEAEPLYIKALEIRKKIFGENSIKYASSLNQLGALYFQQKKYSAAEPLYVKSNEIDKEILGENHPDYLISLNNLATLYVDQQKFQDAEQIFLKTIEIRQKYLGLNHLDVAMSLIHLSDLYFDQGKYYQAEPLCIKALEIRKELLGKKNRDYIKTIGKMANIYFREKKYLEAENLYLEGLMLKKELFGENDPSYLLSLKNLASLYESQGKYSEAEKYYLNIVNIKKNTIGEKQADYISSLNYLAVIFYYQGKYIDAELLYKKVIDLSEDVIGKKNITYASYLNNLAELYRVQNKFDKAIVLYEESINICTEINKVNNKIYFISLNNLAILYSEMNNDTDAEPLLIRVLEWNKSNFGEESSNYATSLCNLGGLNCNTRKYSEAQKYILKSADIRKKVLGEKHPLYALSLGMLANIYSKLGNFSKSLEYNLKSFEIRKEVLGVKHLDYISSLSCLAGDYQDLNINEKAFYYTNEFLNARQNRLINDFYSFTEDEILLYLKYDYVNLIRPYSFLLNLPFNYPDINNNLFLNELLFKNLSLRNRERTKISIQNNGDKLLQEKYKKFIKNKTEIASYQELSPQNQPANFDILIQETEQIEKELVSESSTFSDYINGMKISLNDIKNKIKKNEVIIDLVAFNYINKIATDSLVYAAFIVKKDSKFPKFIPLFEEKQLDFLLSRNKTQQDSTRINKQYLGKDICNLFLKPLEKELERVTTIYLSPSGLGNQIDFGALPIKDIQTFGEKYKLHILSSPAELIDYKVATLEKKSKIELLLYGGIDYTKSNGNPSLNVDDNAISSNEDFINSSKRSGIEALPGTLKEVDGINVNANKSGFSSKIFKESEATEESIKALDGKKTPYVLHLATHGYFFPDPVQEIQKDVLNSVGKSKIYKTSDDPMMRSGLLLAGAKNYWGKSNQNNTIEDGILTASEISNLDLSACQLVVLSACETGLGEVKGSEGVFGLQRAFKMAGVKNIIMSLWKVPDTQTAALFDIFYSECFAGKSIHEAFQSAQSQMKAKYSPYYWAGFVLLE